jgi:galactose mutarotase-like enzyme
MASFLDKLTRRRDSAAASGALPGEVELSASGARVVIIPALGGRITALELGGRQWLAEGPPPNGDLPESARGGATGFEEAFPTVAAARLASRHTGLAIDFPNLGEARTLRPEVEVVTLDGALEATCTWSGQRLPYRFIRVVRVEPNLVTMRYVATNRGSAPLPFVWAANAAFPLEPSTRISLPETARARVLAQHHVDLLGVGAEHRWPRFRTTKKLVDMTAPDTLGQRFACHLAFEMPAGVAAIVEGGQRLEVRFDHSVVTHTGLAVRKRMGGAPDRGVTLQPAIGVPDALSQAAGVNPGAAWLEPGASREWELSWRATRD